MILMMQMLKEDKHNVLNLYLYFKMCSFTIWLFSYKNLSMWEDIFLYVPLHLNIAYLAFRWLLGSN